MSKHAAWSHSLWNDMEEDDDSDTDSRLSGSVAVDSVMRRMQQKNSYVPPGEGGDTRGNEFTLDPDSVTEDTDGGRGSQSTNGSSSTQGGYRSSNGYRTGVSPSQTKRGGVGMMGLSPKSNSRSMGYVNVRLGPREYQGRRNDYLLSPVPENMSGRQVANSSASDVGVVIGNTRGWMGSGHLGNGPLHRSMEMMHQGGRNSPGLMGRVLEDVRGDGYRSPHSYSSGSSEGISHSNSEHNRLIPPSGATVLRRSTIGPSPSSTPHPPYHPPNIGPGRSPQLPSRFHHHHDNNMAFHNPHNLLGQSSFVPDNIAPRHIRRQSLDLLDLDTPRSKESGQTSLSAGRSMDFLDVPNRGRPPARTPRHPPDTSPTLPLTPSGLTPSMRLSFDGLDSHRVGVSRGHAHPGRRPYHHTLQSVPLRGTSYYDREGYNRRPAKPVRTSVCFSDTGYGGPPHGHHPLHPSSLRRGTGNWYDGGSVTSLSQGPAHHSRRVGYPVPVRPHYQLRHDVLEQHHVSGIGHAPSTASTREPNLNDVIDYLSSPNPSNVANAAAYLQHLAYGDDSMKAKIRQYGGIPALISQLRSHDSVQAQLAILGALRNLSYGRANVENKLQIAGDAGLPELSLVLKSARHPEVKELVTSILWNLSSCDDIKFRILQICLKDLVETILIPHSGYNYASLAVKDFSVRPNVTQWSPEMRNTLGALRNISSSGEDTRRFLRVCPHLVDALMWIVRAATGQEDTDDKTAENAMCILRNLSYRLEYEVDPLEGAQDQLDEEWERQVLAEIDDNRREEGEGQPRGRSKSFLSLCTRPRTADNLRRSVPRLATPQNLVCPDKSTIPRRIHAVTGVSLLWQPEVVFPYLALLEKFTSTPELMEAAAGAIQNLTACAWKWSVYVRYLVRKSMGLTLLIDLLNHSHDTVVRSAATALRNLAVDYPNKRIIGLYGIQNILPRLPYGQNNLGIAEQTNVALLCALMELTLNNYENARVFRENSGISQLVKLTRSKDHTPRIIYAAQKLCSILYEIKITKSSLKQEGWDMREYQHLSAENGNQFEFERAGFSNTELRRSGRSSGNGSGGNGGTGGKEKKGRKKSNDENIAPTERRGSQPSLALPPTPQGSTSGAPPQMRSVIEPDPIEPSYQTVEVSKQHLTNQNRPPVSIQPIGMYAEIGVPPDTQQRRPSEPLPPQPDQSDSQTRSEPRSSPVDHNTQDGSEDESNPASGLAVYAQVDMGKKRASRKQKQQQDRYREEVFIGGQQRPHPPQPDDSWV